MIMIFLFLVYFEMFISMQTFFTLAHLELFVSELPELPPGCFKVPRASPAAAAGVISKAGGQHSSSAGGTTQVWKLEEKKET